MIADRTRRDSGFTLPELLISIVVLGLIVSALAAAFVVVVRTSPTSEARADDSRSLLNLTNWISQDVSSTEETGFAVGNVASGCTGVPASVGLMELHWSEGAKTYVSNYRYVTSGSKGTIHRYTCLLGGAASDLKLTPDLQNATTGSLAPAPVAITLVPNGTGGNKGVQFVVTVFDENGVQRELLSHDATTTNVHSTLPPAGGSGGNPNDPPLATRGFTSVVAGGSVTYSLPVTDPDGDVMFTTLSNIPTGWNITAIGTDVTITPDPLAVPGMYMFDYMVNDPSNATASNSVDVEITATTGNQPPVANNTPVTASRTLPSTVTLQASDPEDGTNLTVTLSGVPAGWSATVSGLDLTVTPPVSAASSASFNYTVTDTQGATATSTVTVSVCTVSGISLSENPVGVHTGQGNAGQLKKDVNVSITTNGACGGALVLAFKPKQADAVETTIQFQTSTQVKIAKAAYSWDTVSRTVTLNVRQGANGPVEISTTLQVQV